MKKVVLLGLGRKARLGNQLWNFAGIYAYCLEKGIACENYCLEKYAYGFRFKKPPFLFRWKAYRELVRRVKGNVVVSSLLKEVDLSSSLPRLNSLEKSDAPVIYLVGEKFRNETGLKKYRERIVTDFAPTLEVQRKVNNFLSPLRKRYKRVVGVHIRQGDYRNWRGGEFYFSPKEVRRIVDSYLKFYSLDPKKTVFVLTSDEPIDQDDFAGLEYVISSGGAVEDWYMLSRTDLILGSNSTFGTFAAYFGGIPMVMFERGGIDWRKFR